MYDIDDIYEDFEDEDSYDDYLYEDDLYFCDDPNCPYCGHTGAL